MTSGPLPLAAPRWTIPPSKDGRTRFVALVNSRRADWATYFTKYLIVWFPALLLVGGRASLSEQFQLRVPSAAAYVSGAFVLALCLAVLTATVRTKPTLIDGYVLVLLSFIMAYPASGFAHLLNQQIHAGYYDLADLDASQQTVHYYKTLGLVCVAALGLCAGLRPGQSGRHTLPKLAVGRPAILLALGVIFAASGVYGFIRLAEQTPRMLENMALVDRSLSNVGGGYARYYFLSRWLPWGATFLCMAALSTRLRLIPPVAWCIVILTTLVCAATTAYSGGRAELVLATLPCLALAGRVLPASRRALILAGLCFLMALIGAVSAQRTLSEGAVQSAIELVDWQNGRFSQASLALDIVEFEGHDWGRTQLHGLAKLGSYPLYLLGFPPIINSPQLMINKTGEYLFSNSSITYVVSGSLAEFYYNANWVGVLVGFLVVGRLARAFARWLESARDVATYLLALNGILVISAWLIPGCGLVWIDYLLLPGFPAITLFICETAAKRAR